MKNKRPAVGGAAPSAWRERHKAARHIDDLLPFFDPFGRKPEDEERERDLVRYLPAAAAYYNALRHPPRASVVRGQLDRAHKALWRAELAMRSLGAPAANYVLGYKPELAPYLASPSDGGGPQERSEAFEAAFGLALSRDS